MPVNRLGKFGARCLGPAGDNRAANGFQCGPLGRAPRPVQCYSEIAPIGRGPGSYQYRVKSERRGPAGANLSPGISEPKRPSRVSLRTTPKAGPGMFLA